MTSPQAWRTTEYLEADTNQSLGYQRAGLPAEDPPQGAEHLPARIPSELPIALHRTGVHLLKLVIDVFPQTTGHLALRPFMRIPSNTEDMGPKWEDPRAACQKLESFIFDLGDPDGFVHLVAHPEPVRRIASRHIPDLYLSQPASGVCEDAHALLQIRGGDSHVPKDCYPLGTVLESMVALPHISFLSIRSINVTEAQLVKLF